MELRAAFFGLQSLAKDLRTLNTAATALAGWLKSRGLILKAVKSQVLTISPRQHLQEVTVKSGDCLLPSVSSARYLGIHLDNRLDWDTHVGVILYVLQRTGINCIILFIQLARSFS